VHLSIFISVINQLDAQNVCFTVSLFHASTCFEHMCSSSGGQNCITRPLVSSYLQVAVSCTGWETATYRCDDTRGCVMQFWPPNDEHMCSKHVETWNKLIVKQKFCASSWFITEINVQFMFSFIISQKSVWSLDSNIGLRIYRCTTFWAASINFLKTSVSSSDHLYTVHTYVSGHPNTSSDDSWIKLCVHSYFPTPCVLHVPPQRQSECYT